MGRRTALSVLFLTPAFVLVVVLTIMPLVMSLGLSFVHWDISNRVAGIRWAGLRHWARLICDKHFHHVLLNTILYFAIGIPVQFLLGSASPVPWTGSGGRRTG